MGFYIEDDKKVIKTSHGYIFMCLGGSNNVTTHTWVGGKKGWAEVRAREWMHLNQQILNATESEIMDFCQRVYTDPEEEMFKKGSKWLLGKDMPNYFKSGIQRAQSLEDLLSANPGQALYGSIRRYSDKDTFAGVKEIEKSFKTTAELEEWLEQANALRQKYLADGEDCYIHLYFSIPEPLRYNTTEKDSRQIVVKSGNSFVESYIKDSRLSFTGELEKAFIFDSVEAAKAAIGNCWRNVKFVSLEGQQKAQNKQFSILFQGGTLNGLFLQKQTSRKVYGTAYTKSAKKFASEREATRYAQALRDKGYDRTRCNQFVLVNAQTGLRNALQI